MPTPKTIGVFEAINRLQEVGYLCEADLHYIYVRTDVNVMPDKVRIESGMGQRVSTMAVARLVNRKNA